MKKIMICLLAAAIVFCGAALAKTGFGVSAAESKYVSPTAPTITVNPSDTSVPIEPVTATGTGVYPSSPTSPASGTTVSGTAVSVITRATGTGTGTESSPGLTTPDGSSVTGPLKPDTNPESPKTGGNGAAVFVFAGIALAASGAALMLRKKEDNT